MSATATKTDVRERPIIFSGPMVKVILEGRKTQTRRVVKGLPSGIVCAGPLPESRYQYRFTDFRTHVDLRCPYGRPQLPLEPPNSRLWVREKWYCAGEHECDGYPVRYEIDADLTAAVSTNWRTPIFMPRWASRITLGIAEIEVQRVQEISEADAIAEGLDSVRGDGGAPGPGFKWKGIGYHGAGFAKDGAKTYHFPNGDAACACNAHGPTPAQCAYREAWDSINAKRGYSWESNPWVWVITFKKL